MGIPTNQENEKVRAKIRDKNKKKIVHPVSWKPEKAVQAKVRDMKKMNIYIPLDWVPHPEEI